MKRSKYWAERLVIDWIKFDSKVEWKYYLDLKEMKKDWKILDFGLQPKFVLQDKFEKHWMKYRAIHYVADFLIKFEEWMEEIIDIKWMATNEAKMKRKLFDKKYPDKSLRRIVYVKKRWGWIDYDENVKMKRAEKKEKWQIKSEN